MGPGNDLVPIRPTAIIQSKVVPELQRPQCAGHMNEWGDGDYIDGLAQDSSNAIADALELLQCCAMPSIYTTTPYEY